jgi:Elongator subunit Iki1
MSSATGEGHNMQSNVPGAYLSVPCPFILVDVPAASSPEALDVGVIPALLALIAEDVASALHALCVSDAEPPVRVAAVALSRPVLAIASTLPPKSIVRDGFSDWAGYSHTGSLSDCNGDCVHVAGADGAQAVLDALTACTAPATASSTDANGAVILVVDDIGPLLRAIPDVTCVARALDGWRVTGRAVAFIAALSEPTDLSSERDVRFANTLKRLATTHVRVSQAAPLASSGKPFSERRNMVSSTVHFAVTRLRPSGRVYVEATTALFDCSAEKCTLVVSSDMSGDKSVSEAGEETQPEEHVAREKMAKLGLTFNIDLTQKEREARRNVRLPYVHQDEDLANSGLELHPESLRLSALDRTTTQDLDVNSGSSTSSSSADDLNEEYEESEDV